MSELGDKQHKKLLERFGSEEAILEWRRENQRKSRTNYAGTGGFAYMKQHDPKRLAEISARAGRGGNKNGEETDQRTA